MKSHELTIQGMTCGHCVMHVRKGLSTITNLEIESVDVGKARVLFDEGQVTPEALRNAVEEAGYTLVEVK